MQYANMLYYDSSTNYYVTNYLIRERVQLFHKTYSLVLGLEDV